jgi:hypothetical protein
MSICYLDNDKVIAIRPISDSHIDIEYYCRYWENGEIIKSVYNVDTNNLCGLLEECDRLYTCLPLSELNKLLMQLSLIN